MNTVQNYVGRGNYANTPPQPAKNGLSLTPAAQSEPAINPRIFQAQARLLELCDKFTARGNYDPLQAVGDLLHHWLATPAETLTEEGDKDQLHAVLLLIDTLNEVYPIDGLPTFSEDGERQEPFRLFDRYALRLAPDYLNRLDLTEEEEQRTGLVLAPNDSMAPQILAGAELVIVAYDPSEYAQASGVVIASPDCTPRRYLIGRIAHNDGNSILLLADNPECQEETLLLSDLRYLAQVRYLLNREVI
ncbi:S24 family peptidase [Spirosoma sp. BT702]|uniref:S24 family peptidase n=1 Tax=Spirosoma profusum TaxID=2771354 RepID=A0A926Y0E5_9BACT|nr:S24 family peptidase [Spirosoma profusum]MBD2704167.1 S24 family peptidase [Spirosoma profusum]